MDRPTKEAYENLRQEILAQIPEFIIQMKIRKLEEQIKQYAEEKKMSNVEGLGYLASKAPYVQQLPQQQVGVFADLLSVKWRVTGMGVTLNPITQEEEYTATLVDAAANESGHFWNQRTFRVSEEQYLALDLNDIVSLNISVE